MEKAAVGTRKLGLGTLTALAVGQAIGSGVITATGLAVGVTGRSTWIAYAATVLLAFIVILPVLFYASVVKFKGGQYTLVASLMGDRWGGIYSLASITMCISGGLAGTAMGSYINSVFPFVDIRVAAIACLTLFFVLNLFGVNIMAKFQNFMAVFLIICLMGFGLVGLGHLQPGTFAVASEGYFSGGGSGFASAIIFLIYAATGHSLVVAFSNDAKEPKKNIPKAMMITTGIIMVIYVLVGLVAANVLPVDLVAGKPLTLVASKIFPTPIFVIFIFGGPIMALATTINAGYPALCAPILGGTRDGWLPKGLAKTNRYGAPYLLYIGMYVISILPILLNFSLATITNNTVLVNYILKILVILAIFSMPKKFGEHWEQSPYHLKNPVFYVLMGLSLVIQVGIIVLSAKALSLPLLIGNILVVAFLVGYALYRYKTGKAQVGISYSFDD